MSTPGHGPSHSSIDDDGIDIKKILLIGVGSLGTFALSAVVAYLMLRHDTNEYQAKGTPPRPALVGKAEIGIIDTAEFDKDPRLEDWKKDKQKRLQSYGWVDKQKSLIHIPIDKAIDQVVADSATGNQQ
jgi:hypothetical protein